MYLAGFLFLINFRKVIIVPGLIATISLRHTSSVEETDSFGQTFFLFGLFDSKYFLLYDSKHSFSFFNRFFLLFTRIFLFFTRIFLLFTRIFLFFTRVFLFFARVFFKTIFFLISRTIFLIFFTLIFLFIFWLFSIFWTFTSVKSNFHLVFIS